MRFLWSETVFVNYRATVFAGCYAEMTFSGVLFIRGENLEIRSEKLNFS